VTSTRLLVTSHDTLQLIHFDADGNELRCVELPDDMEPLHAMESPTRTFIISLYNTQVGKGQVIEVNTGGEVLRHFSGSRLRSLGRTEHVAVDSQGNIFVADFENRYVCATENSQDNCWLGCGATSRCLMYFVVR